MPRPETLAEYYGSYRQDTDLKVTFFSPKRFAEHILQLSGKQWPRSIVRILDFGGGDGALSIAVAGQLLTGKNSSAKCIEIDVIDYSQHPAAPPDPSISIRQLTSLRETRRDSYDLVIASSVIEHIPEPMPVLRDLFDALRIGGCLYARTPWVVPVLQILAKLGVSFDFTFPAHVHDLSKDFWEHVNEHLGNGKSITRLIHSRPSIVETRFAQAPFRTLVAYMLKAPWGLMPSRYNLVGGWEVMFERVK